MQSQLSVLSFNILGTPFLTTHQLRNYSRMTRYFLKRTHVIGELLNTSDADMLLLQEVYTYPTLRVLRNHLTNFPYVVYKPYFFAPRGGLVIFSKIPLEQITYTDFVKHGSLRNKSFVAKITQNGILCAKVAGEPLYIINTNLTADTEHKWNSRSKFYTLKLAQLQQLIFLTESLKTAGDILMGGDFNMAKDSEVYQMFLQQIQATDLFATSRTPTQHREFLPRHVIPPRLDYIFLTQHFHTVQVIQKRELFTTPILLNDSIESFLSDHIALQADIILKSKISVQKHVQPHQHLVN